MSSSRQMSEKGRKLFSTSLDGGDSGENTLFLKYKNEFPSGDPLICACEKNRIEDVENMIQILLETNNNKSRINNEGKTSRGVSFTPLGIAARKGYLNIVQLLIENGVDSSIYSKRDKWNVLHIAAYYSKKSSNVVEYLLKHLSEKVINQQDVGGETPLDNAYSNPYRVKDEIVNCMIKYGALSARRYNEKVATKKKQDETKKEKENRRLEKEKKRQQELEEEEERRKKKKDEEDRRLEEEKKRQQELENEDAKNKKKGAAYIKWEKEFDGKTKVNLREKNLTDEDALAIGELLKTNKTLKKLYLYNTNITDVQSIGEGLKTNNTLKELYLDNNNITDDSGIQSIIDGLKTNNTLRYLYLYNNQLSDNRKLQLKAIQQCKRDGSNGYQQVKEMQIHVYYVNKRAEQDATKKEESERKRKRKKKRSKMLRRWKRELRGKTGVDLKGKNLTDEDVLAIGELLKTNYTLKKLDLGINNITDVQSIGEGLKTNNKLKELWLHHNNITDVQCIGEALKTNYTLEILHLSGNNITDVQSIGEVLKTNKTLKGLYLSGNNITNVQSIGEALKRNNTLKDLRLGGNKNTDVQSIGEALKTNNTLEILHLTNNIIDVQSICEALKTNNTLRYLYLGGNKNTDVQSIGEGLKTNNTLKDLRLDNNNITDVQSIIDVLKTNNTLETLHLYNNPLSDDMKSQLKAIQQYKRDGSNGYQQVKEIQIHVYYLDKKAEQDAYMNGIGGVLKRKREDKLRQIKERMAKKEVERKQKKLHIWKRRLQNVVVDLERKKLTDEDAYAIGEALKTNNTLKELNLAGNNITDVQSIGEGLKTNNTLQRLSLQYNNITDVQSIGEALKTNHKLNSLRLNNNNITDVTSIGEALKTNKTLTRLSLSYNNITDVQSIIDGLKTNKRLYRLYLDSNQLSRNMKSQLKIIQRYKRDGLNGYQQVGGRGHNQQLRIRTS